MRISRPKRQIKCFTTIVISVLANILCVNQAQAGTATFFAQCSFLDHKSNNGGNISRMPCYVYMGGNISHTFFHILWKDGVKTNLNGKNTGFITDQSTRKTYKTSYNDNKYTFIANSDSDVITIENISSSRPYSEDVALEKLNNGRKVNY